MQQQPQAIGVALLNHENIKGKFPPGAMGWNKAGTIFRGHTAFLQILPFVEQEVVESQLTYEDRFISAANRNVYAAQIPVYQCPSDNAAGRVMELVHPWGVTTYHSRSNYVLCFGKGGLLPSGQVYRCDVTMPEDRVPRAAPTRKLENGGPFRMEVGRKIQQFQDGTSHTIVVSEVRAGQPQAVNGLHDYRGCWSWPWFGSLYSTSYAQFERPG